MIPAMNAPLFAAVILAAGQGSRMKAELPKVLHKVAQRPMLYHVLDAVAALKPARTVVVTAPGMAKLLELPRGVETVIQHEPGGTGDAVAAARAALNGFDGDVLVLYGDTPLVTAETMAKLLAERRRAPQAALAVAGMRVPPPNRYGRLVLAKDGVLDAIIEAKDCSAAQLALDFVNAGPMAVDGRALWPLIEAIDRNNAQREYYLTDIVAAAKKRGLTCRAIEAPAQEMAGVNDRAELAAAEALMQNRLRAAAMAAGVNLIAPETVFFAADTRIGKNSTISPYVVFGPGVEIGERVEVAGFSHIAGARIGDNARIGPFARLRPGTELAEDVHIGNFVEIKNARLEAGVKANHLAYLGDAEIGARSNIGAGTITCNYDGFEKHRTEIGADVFVGTNSSLVAPLKVGDGAMIGAGSTVTEDVPKQALAIARGRQATKKGAAKAWRDKRKAALAKAKKKR
jgi:bifunctional UDP-N-acetylglucosamine pyrophosphorylase / glucosamine-1-phosphate N-acetyltransferase